MKMNSRKIFGFCVSIAFLLILWFSSMLLYRELLDIIADKIIGVLPFILVILVGGNSMDKFTKSKHYKSELDDSNK